MCRLADISSKSILLQVARQGDPKKMLALVEKIATQGVTREQLRKEQDKPKPGRPEGVRVQLPAADQGVQPAPDVRKKNASKDEVISALEAILEDLRHQLSRRPSRARLAGREPRRRAVVRANRRHLGVGESRPTSDSRSETAVLFSLHKIYYQTLDKYGQNMCLLMICGCLPCPDVRRGQARADGRRALRPSRRRRLVTSAARRRRARPSAGTVSTICPRASRTTTRRRIDVAGRGAERRPRHPDHVGHRPTPRAARPAATRRHLDGRPRHPGIRRSIHETRQPVRGEPDLAASAIGPRRRPVHRHRRTARAATRRAVEVATTRARHAGVDRARANAVVRPTAVVMFDAVQRRRAPPRRAPCRPGRRCRRNSASNSRSCADEWSSPYHQNQSLPSAARSASRASARGLRRRDPPGRRSGRGRGPS